MTVRWETYRAPRRTTKYTLCDRSDMNTLVCFYLPRCRAEHYLRSTHSRLHCLFSVMTRYFRCLSFRHLQLTIVARCEVVQKDSLTTHSRVSFPRSFAPPHNLSREVWTIHRLGSVIPCFGVLTSDTYQCCALFFYQRNKLSISIRYCSDLPCSVHSLELALMTSKSRLLTTHCTT